MTVHFGPLMNDGTMLVDGVHDIVTSDAMATQVLTALGQPTTIPGEAPGRDLYAAIEAFIAGPTYAAMSQGNKDIVQRVRIGIAAGARIESGLIAWRAV